jgi:hypothetical protein
MTIPISATNPDHSEIIIWALLAIIAYLSKLTYDATKGWKARVEEKLDEAIHSHHLCQTSLPEKFVTRGEFEKLLITRAKEWTEFKDMFREFIDKFWKHNHNHAGKPEVP